MVVSEKPKDATSKQDRKHRLKHRFEVVKKLGQGTYGKVQLAVNKETNQEVAIKTIKKSKIESEQDLVRIRREIQIMSSIQHPQIIHIYEVFENKEKIVLVMQYASGGELYDYLSERKVLSDTEARRIFRQIAAAIYYCHKNKICHRDLKLENVLLDERGNAKIADFGLSNVFDDRHLLGTFCGSPLYASPEIVKGTPYYGPEVDCWSMGVLLYTLVYGAMPFDGSNFKRLVKQISEGDYYEPKKKSDASSLIRQLLTVSASKRATIIDICTNWWVNQGYEHSLLQVAEDMANLTPVRIDLLLALAPVSPTPPSETVTKEEHPLQAKMNEKREETQEGARSDSFSFISGGMANNMKNISSENPDDIFHGDENSDEEFLPADVAAALEGQCVKRPAEKSFEGSMVRVSSIAHRSKKPRKSDSRNNEKREEAELGSTDETLHIESTGSQEIEETKREGDDGVSESGSEAIAETTTIPAEMEVIMEEEAKKPSAADAQSTTPQSPTKDSKQSESLPLQVKKTKPEIPAKGLEKLKKETSPTKSVTRGRERSPQKTTRPQEKRERSPQKNQVPKVLEKRERSPQKNLVSKPLERRARSPQKSQGQKPQERRDSSPQKNQASKPQEKSADAAKRRPGKLIMPKFLDSTTNSSPSTTSPPKSADAKKVVIPCRSVSDAKRAFEVKNKTSPSIQKKDEKQPSLTSSSSKKDEKSAPPGKRIIFRKKKETSAAEKTEDQSKKSPKEEKAANKETPPRMTTAVGEPDDVTCKLEASASPEDIETTVEDRSPSSEPGNIQGSEVDTKEGQDGDVTPVANEDDEGKKLAAKSILKKTIAKARLAERKLSQQSSMDSESSSCTPPVLPPTPSSNSSSKSAVPSYFKTPKPFVKEQPDVKVQSKAEITLSPTQANPCKDSVSKEESEVPRPCGEDEAIWRGPLPPASNRPLQRSVLSSSIESDMNNWRQEVEESLKRLSPEGASDDHNYKTNVESNSQDVGPAPISRSYKKFTFTKDGSCITETGQVYTAPRDDGTWTKVEKKTKVTTLPSIKEDYNKAKQYREASPLRHSDSQSSSGSNDIFDDIFDSWTGDSMICNRMKNLFGRFSKDSLRRERRRDSMRRSKAEREKLRGGHLTDRESSDNEEDYDVHFDNFNNPVMYGSQGISQFLRSMNKDFPMKSFREHYGPTYSRSLSRERRESDAGHPRSRETTRPADYYPVRSVSRERTQSPRGTVLQFVIGSPRRQSSIHSEPRAYEETWKEQVPPQRESGVGTWNPRSESDYVFHDPTESPEAFVDRASMYGTIRPKIFQRYMKRRDLPDSPLTPQSTKSGPELLSKVSRPVEDLDENRRQRVEHWLQMSERNVNPLTDCGPEQARAKQYTRSSSDKIPNREDLHQISEERRTPSTGSLDGSKRSFRSEVKMDSNAPMYRTISEIQFNNRIPSSPESFTFRQHPTLEDHIRAGNVKYTRSLSNNLNQIGITTSSNSVIEMETPVASPSSGQQTPVLRMRVSFNRNNLENGQPQPCEIPSSTGLWSQVSSPRSDYNEGRSLLEALKMRGYRNVMSQRLQSTGPAEQGPVPESPSPEKGVEQDQGSAGETPQRGKAPRYASTPKADNESNACCMETNNTEKKLGVPNGEVSDGTLTPDSLDGKGSEKPKSYEPKNYEEESVSDRIRRKSYFMRFNDDRPKRRTPRYRDNFIPDLPGSIWSRFAEDSAVEDDDLLLYPRPPRRTGSFRTPKRTSANLEDLLDYRMSSDGIYRSSSRSSQILDGFLSDDGLWGSGRTSRRASTSSPGYYSSYTNGTHEDEPGSLWKQRSMPRSFTRYPYVEPSVIDTVPDLSEVWKSSRPSAFSFYSPTVTPKSPVMSPGSNTTPTNSGAATPRHHSLVGSQFTLAEELEDQNNRLATLLQEGEDSPQDILNKALNILSNIADN